MTQNNYEQILSSYDYVLLDFFLPWCGPCQKLGPEFANAASRLKALNKPIALAQVNANENPALVQKYTIIEYPTLKFFAVGVELPYKGGDTEDEIYKWMRVRAISSTKLLTSSEHLEEVSETNDMIIVYLGQIGESFNIYEKVTKTYENLNFAHYFEPEQDSPNRVIMIKKEKKIEYSPEKFNFHELRAFINRHQTGVVLPLDKYNAYKIFDEGKPGIVLLLDDSMRSDQALEDLRAVLGEEQDFKEKFIAYYGDYNQEFPKTFMQLFDIKNEDLPQIRIVNPQKNSKTVDKYEPLNLGNISINYINIFGRMFLAGSLKKSIKSQPIPRDNNEKVKVLVGKTYDSVVYDESKDVLVNFYAHWCHHCQQFEPIYKNLAEQISNNNIILAKIDASQNEFDGVQINSYPTLKFFPAKAKGNPIQFEGNRDLPTVLEFIKKHTTFPWPSFEQNSNEPFELTMGNFDDIVYKSDKHVLVNFYITPCGYCKQMDQTYKEIIKEVKELGIELIVTRIEWMNNNIPRLEVKAFPSVLLFLKDNKDHPIDYIGDRSLEDFMRFIKENCQNDKKNEVPNEELGKIDKIDKKNFKEKVYNENYDFVLLLYKKKMMETHVETLVKLFENLNKPLQNNVLFGEMDVEKYQLPEEINYQIDFGRIPSLVIFIRQYKRSPTQFIGDIGNFEEVTKFIIKESSFTLENNSQKNEKANLKCDENKCKEEL